MKRLSTYLNEKLVVNKNYKQYIYAPKSFNELRKIIEQRYKKQGPGTKQKPIDFNDINISNIDSFLDEEEMGIFEKIAFEYIDISGWDVSNVEDISNMFYECKQLKSIGDLSNWDVSNVKDMSFMFYMCHNLKSVGNLSNWDVSNVENMSWLFYECKKIESVGDLSNWTVSKVEDAGFMFCDCTNLKSVGDLSNWDVSNVENADFMFSDSGITNIPDWYEE